MEADQGQPPEARGANAGPRPELSDLLAVGDEDIARAAGEVGGGKFHLRAIGGDYLRLTWSGVAVMRADAQEAVDAVASLSGGTPLPLLVDMRTMRSIEREARALLGTTDVASRVALLVGTPLSRTLGSFSLRLARPATPMRIFSHEAAAVAWSIGDGG